MKNLFLTLLLIPFSVTFAQQDAGSKLDKISAKLLSYDAVHIDFSFSLENVELEGSAFLRLAHSYPTPTRSFLPRYFSGRS